MYNKSAKIPTATEIMAILVTDPKMIDKDANKKAILNWYFDRWLPVAAGSLFWGTTIRYYHYPTDKEAVIPGVDQKRVLVTVASEAFGFLTLENYHVSTENLDKISRNFTQTFGTYFFEMDLILVYFTQSFAGKVDSHCRLEEDFRKCQSPGLRRCSQTVQGQMDGLQGWASQVWWLENGGS